MRWSGNNDGDVAALSSGSKSRRENRTQEKVERGSSRAAWIPDESARQEPRPTETEARLSGRTFVESSVVTPHPDPLPSEGRGNPRRLRAFSLIEVVGVMAVLALIAAAAVPTFIKRLDHDARTTEIEMLRAITNGFIQASLETRQIQGAANIPTVVGAYLGFSASQISNNTRGFLRQFIVHPALDINGSTLPYTQPLTGAVNVPINGRILILATVATPLPALNPSASEFAEIWDAPENSIPGPLSAWGGQGEDLLIARIELAPLFRRVMLVNVDPTPNIGRFAINSFATTWANGMPFVNYTGGAATKVSAFYLENTVFNFYHPNANLDTRDVVRSDMSFLYQNNRWSRRLGGSDDSIGDFGQLAAEFLKPPAPADPKFAATQQSVINEFFNFLYSYSLWAYGDPSTVTNKSGTAITPAIPQYDGAGGPGAPNYPYYAEAAEAQVHMDDFTDNLIH